MKDRLLARLGRTTSGHKVIPEIDGLRFFAIATVLAFHSNIQAARSLTPGISDLDLHAQMSTSAVASIFAQGDVGVPVFFAISGFILGLPFARHRRNLGPAVGLQAYFGRRLSRLEVPFLVSLVLALLAQIAVGAHWTWQGLAASASYTHMLAFGTRSTINPVSWSLEIEVQFYCLAPLLALVFVSRSPMVRIVSLISIMSASMALATWFKEPLEAAGLSLTILRFGHFFVTGFLALELFMAGLFDRRRGASFWFDALGAIAVLALLWPGESPELVRSIVFVPAVLALFAAAFRGRAFHDFFTNPWITVLGGMCYSIYLLHYGIMILAAKVGGATLVRIAGVESIGSASLLFAALLIPVSVLPCVLFFVAVEKPCMQRGWHQRLIGRGQELMAGARNRIGLLLGSGQRSPVLTVPPQSGDSTGPWARDFAAYRMYAVEGKPVSQVAVLLGIPEFQAKLSVLRGALQLRSIAIKLAGESDVTPGLGLAR